MIYVVRHGQTDWNLQGKIQGSTDIPLNETGLEQARAAAEALKNVKFDVVFCSPLKRTRQTCEIIYDGKIIFDDRLKEINYGDFEGQHRNSLSFPFDDFWNTEKNLIEKNAESMTDLENRVFGFYDEILKKYPDKTILVVCHGGTIRATKGYFLGRPPDGDYIKTFGFEVNSSIIKFENKRREK